MSELHRVPLVPTTREGKPVRVHKANELPVVLDFVFKEFERQVNLASAQVREAERLAPSATGDWAPSWLGFPT